MENKTLHDWHASWIWQHGDDPSAPNKYVYFRREFKLDRVPASGARLRVSADTCYLLFINGVRVGRGPVLTEPRWQTFDTYHVADLLRPGRNVVGAIVYHYGNAATNPNANTFHESRGGFLFQLDLEPGAQQILSDESWMTLEASAWKRDVPKIDRMTFSEMFDARREPAGWLESGIELRGWSPAEQVRGDPIVQLWNWNPADSVVMPWLQLEPRPLPPFEIVAGPPTKILYSGEVLQRAEPYHTDDLAVRMSLEQPLPSHHTRIEKVESLLDASDDAPPVTIHPFPTHFTIEDFPGVHDPCIALDAGKLINGRVRLDVTAPEGTLIDVGYAQLTVDGRVIPYLSQRTPLADEFITRDGRQTLETYNWRNFRYILLVFRQFHEPIQLHRFTVEQERYPYETVGSFQTSDESLDWVWKVCADTVEAGTYDRLMDNPVRERREYLNDVHSALPAIYAAFGAPAIVDKYFTDILRSQFAYGHFPHTVLGNRREAFGLFLESPFLLFQRVWEHYELFGDIRKLETFDEPLRRYLEFIQGYTNKDNLFDQTPFTIFIDWADIERRGQCLVVNMLYAEALRIYGRIVLELGDAERAEQWTQRAQQVRETLQKLYWDAERGLFVDSILNGEPSRHISEHANFLMMQFGCATEEQCASIAKALCGSESSIGRVSPAFIWSVEGLFRTGQTQWAMDLLRRRYACQREQGIETVGELWNLLGEQYGGHWRSRDSRSVAQMSGVTALYLLSRFVLGIHPAKPGFKEILISPQPGDLKQAQGVWPGPDGPIRVDWQKRPDGTFALNAECPEGIPGNVQLPKDLIAKSEVRMNGKQIEPSPVE